MINKPVILIDPDVWATQSAMRLREGNIIIVPHISATSAPPENEEEPTL